MTESTCQDCGTDWSGTSVVVCPMCDGSNITGVIKVIKPKIKTISVPPGLEDWLYNTMKHITKEPS